MDVIQTLTIEVVTVVIAKDKNLTQAMPSGALRPQR